MMSPPQRGPQGNFGPGPAAWLDYQSLEFVEIAINLPLFLVG
jgi:hypothetical protein